MVCGDIADRIAAGLNGMHIQIGKRVENIGRIDQFRPVKLDVLSRGEVAVSLVPPLRDVRQSAHLLRRQRPIGNSNTEHVSVQLQVYAVHQPQRLELLLRQRSRQPPLYLIPVLKHPLAKKRPIKIVIPIHWQPLSHREVLRRRDRWL